MATAGRSNRKAATLQMSGRKRFLPRRGSITGVIAMPNLQDERDFRIV
jgi:hypothetical protein